MSPPDNTYPSADSFQMMAGNLRAWGMAGLASFLLETSRPLAFVTGQACCALAPLLSPWPGTLSRQLADLGRLLGEEGAVDHLLALLEQQAGGP